MGHPNVPWSDAFFDNEDMFAHGVAGAAYAKVTNFNGFGKQADLTVFANAANHLRITPKRSVVIGEDGNELEMHLHVSGGQVANEVEWDAAALLLTLRLKDDATLSQTEALVNSLTGDPFDTAITGAGGTVVSEQDNRFNAEGGTPDQRRWWEISTDEGDLYMFRGSAAPANDNGSMYVPEDATLRGVLAPGHEVWVKRTGSNDARYGFRVWAPE